MAAVAHADVGLLARPEATAATLVGGWLRTGDLARIDERSLVRLAGRAKEMFVRGGYNVYPAEVEAALAAHPAVTDVAVVPRPDPVMGEVGVAVVVPLDPTAPRRSPTCGPSSPTGWPPTRRPRPSASSTSCRSRRCRRSTAVPSPREASGGGR